MYTQFSISVALDSPVCSCAVLPTFQCACGPLTRARTHQTTSRAALQTCLRAARICASSLSCHGSAVSCVASALPMPLQNSRGPTSLVIEPVVCFVLGDDTNLQRWLLANDVVERCQPSPGQMAPTTWPRVWHGSPRPSARPRPSRRRRCC